MGFNEEYQAFLDGHLKVRKGERHRRLKKGHGEAERLFLINVWWPLFHNFEFLYPEYEVDDFKDGKRFLDFAYIRKGIRICFEIDGYSSHLKEVSRWQFADNLERQNYLIIQGWVVIRFSYDQVKEKPQRCKQVTQQIVGKLLGDEMDQLPLTYIEKEVLRYIIKKGDRITPREIGNLLSLSDKPVRKILTELVRKKLIYPASGTKRIQSYSLCEGVKSPFI